MQSSKNERKKQPSTFQDNRVFLFFCQPVSQSVSQSLQLALTCLLFETLKTIQLGGGGDESLGGYKQLKPFSMIQFLTSRLKFGVIFFCCQKYLNGSLGLISFGNK